MERVQNRSVNRCVKVVDPTRGEPVSILAPRVNTKRQPSAGINDPVMSLNSEE